MKRLKHYKQTRYKAHKKPIDKRILIVCAAAAVIFAASVALGLYLNTVVTETTPEDTFEFGPVAGVPYDDYPKLDASRTGARTLDAQAYLSDKNASDAILRANGNMIGALSIELLTKDGTPAYASEVYRRIYSVPSGNIDLSAFIDKANKSSVSITAIMRTLSLTQDYSDIREQRRTTEAALIKEAYDCGVRDLLLVIPSGIDPDTLYSYAKEIKELAPELVLGAAIDADTLCSDYHYSAKLDDIFDYLAPDISKSFLEDVHKETVSPEPEDTSSSDTESANGEQSGESTEPPSATNTAKVLSDVLVFCERFASKVFIDIGDGCPECLEASLRELSLAGADSFVLSASLSTHKDGQPNAYEN